MAKFCHGDKLGHVVFLDSGNCRLNVIHDSPINHLDKWTQRISTAMDYCPASWFLTLFCIWKFHFHLMSLSMFKHSPNLISHLRLFFRRMLLNFKENLQAIAVCQWYLNVASLWPPSRPSCYASLQMRWSVWSRERIFSLALTGLGTN